MTTPAKSDIPSLEWIVSEMKRLGPENEPETVDWGPDVGSEIIDDDWSDLAAKVASENNSTHEDT